MGLAFVHRVLRLATAVCLAACVRRAPSDLATIPGVQVTAAVDQYRIGPDRSYVRAKATLINRGADTARFAVGGCPLMLHAYAADERDRRSVWNSARLERPCFDIRLDYQLAAGDSAVIEDSFSIDRITSSGLGLGQYAFTVSIRFSNPAPASPEYPAGSLTISR